MRAEAETGSLLSAILPDLSAVSEHSKTAWRPEITDEELRVRLLETASLSSFVLEDLLAREVLSYGAVITDEVTDENIRFLIDQNIESVVRRAGLVVHGNHLARLVLAGDIPTTGADWDVEDLRFALGLRAMAVAKDVENDQFAASVQSSGEGCFKAWLRSLPEPVQRALRLSRHLKRREPADGVVRSDHADIFSACLTRMREL